MTGLASITGNARTYRGASKRLLAIAALQPNALLHRNVNACIIHPHILQIDAGTMSFTRVTDFAGAAARPI